MTIRLSAIINNLYDNRNYFIEDIYIYKWHPIIIIQ